MNRARVLLDRYERRHAAERSAIVAGMVARFWLTGARFARTGLRWPGHAVAPMTRPDA